MQADTRLPVCPHCDTRPMVAAASLPYTRGYLFNGGFGIKTLTGCVTCVRRELIEETGRSALIGWFSIPGLVANPVFIAYGIARSLVVRSDPDRIAALVRTAGGKNSADIYDPLQAAYRLAASMIAADRKTLPSELSTAGSIGQRLFENFNLAEFQAVVSATRDLPEPVELASLLKPLVDADSKAKIYRYLVAVATADGDMAPEEQTLLAEIASRLGITLPGEGIDEKA